jgi:site-specific DNA-methyltransferase (adenine-specific)
MKVTDKITITNEDNMQLMARYPDNYFDLAIVDPPYGIDADVKNNTDKMQTKKSAAKSKKYGSQLWDSDIPTDEYFEELKRVSKRQIIWGANYFGLVGGMIYWHKNVTMPTYSTGELAWVSWLNKLDFVNIAWHGMIQQDMSNKETRIHPTQKPVALYKWILYKYAKEGDKILDTHLGSGSIAIACHDYGFELTACELDEEYYNAAIKRIKNHTAQLSIFHLDN